MKITKQILKQIITEEMDDFEQDLYPGADERGDPDNWDHVYDGDNRYEGGNLTDDEVSEFAAAYMAVEQLRSINPKAISEEVEDAIFAMLGKLGVHL